MPGAEFAARGPDGFFKHVTSNKKVGISADIVCWRCRNNARSVPRDDWATEAVVDAHGDQINVLTDRVGAEYVASRDVSQNASRYEGDVAVTHEKVIVFDRN